MTYIPVAVDMFCGLGGTTEGIEQAFKEAKIPVNLYIFNHDKPMIELNKKNHPNAEHFWDELENIDPREIIPGRRIDYFAASPECIHHSRALGGKPRNKQSRATVKYVVRWFNQMDVRKFLLENVPEFAEWGPLHATCSCGLGVDYDGRHPNNCHFEKPIKARKGQYYRALIRKFEAMGYKVESRVIICADYGAATSRERLFIQGTKEKDGKIVWPRPTHQKKGNNLSGKYRKWKTAEDIIDKSIKGKSIYGRKIPLVKNTLDKIWEGFVKFNGDFFTFGGLSGAAPRPLTWPVHTFTTSGGIHLVEPMIVELEPYIVQMEQGGSVHSLKKPVNTITTGADTWTLIRPYLIEYYGTGGSQLLDQPVKTITTKERFALVEPIIIKIDERRFMLDFLHRMLTPRELANAMSFRKSYKFHPSKKLTTKGIGNSVPPVVAKALMACMI